jgi:hypothetical protein
VRRSPAATLLLLVSLAACSSGTTPAADTAPSPPSPAASSAAATGRTSGPPQVHTGSVPWRLPGALSREAAVLLPDGRHVVVAGGLLPGDTSTAATYTLDLRTGRSTAGRPLPVPVHDTAGVLLHGQVLVLGGGNATEQAVIQRRSRNGWRVTAHLPEPRSDLAAVAAHGTAYVIGGYDGRRPALADVLASTDGRTWVVAGRLRVPVRYAAAVVLNGSLWVIGGERNGAMVDAVQRFDLSTGATRVVARTPRPVGHEAAVAVGHRILLIGGRTSADSATARLWWFDTRGRRFSAAGRLPAPRADTAVVVVHSGAAATGYLIGGETPAFSDRVVAIRITGLSQ